MPFLAEKITGMLYQMLRVCSPAELLEDDEEILGKLAEVLGTCLEYVGGPS